jgi:glycosyltransferase involved in cell wall biosynthesis
VPRPHAGKREVGEKFILTHTGQLYPEQPWQRFFEALQELRSAQPALADRLRVRFVGATSTDVETIRRLERAERTTGLIEQLPTVGPEEAIALQQDSDALLQLALRGRKGYLPVKFLEYLGAHRPIILLSNEQDEMEETITTTGTGSIVSDKEALVAHLMDNLRMHEAGQTLPFNPDEEALRSFDYATNMHRWADQLEAALRSRKPRA